MKKISFLLRESLFWRFRWRSLQEYALTDRVTVVAGAFPVGNAKYLYCFFVRTRLLFIDSKRSIWYGSLFLLAPIAPLIIWGHWRCSSHLVTLIVWSSKISGPLNELTCYHVTRSLMKLNLRNYLVKTERLVGCHMIVVGFCASPKQSVSNFHSVFVSAVYCPKHCLSASINRFKLSPFLRLLVTNNPILTLTKWTIRLNHMVCFA